MGKPAVPARASSAKQASKDGEDSRSDYTAFKLPHEQPAAKAAGKSAAKQKGSARKAKLGKKGAGSDSASPSRSSLFESTGTSSASSSQEESNIGPSSASTSVSSSASSASTSASSSASTSLTSSRTSESTWSHLTSWERQVLERNTSANSVSAWEAELKDASMLYGGTYFFGGDGDFDSSEDSRGESDDEVWDQMADGHEASASSVKFILVVSDDSMDADREAFESYMPKHEPVREARRDASDMTKKEQERYARARARLEVADRKRQLERRQRAHARYLQARLKRSGVRVA